jgi:hypothetical protein
MAFLFGGGCWTHSSTVVAGSTPSNVDDGNQQVVVRLANAGEFPPEPSPDDGQQANPRIVGLAFADCKKAGQSVAAYYRPVVAFARKHLIDKEDRAIHEALAVDASESILGDGVNIIVEPRETLGELRVVHAGPPFNAPRTWWAESRYCLHVLQHAGTTTIAVEEVLRMMK